MAEITVTGADGERLVVHARRGESFRSLLLREGLLIDFPCGGQGRCGKCRIAVEPGPAGGGGEAHALPEGLSLACRMRVEGDCRVTLPRARALVTAGPPAAEDEQGHLYAGPPRVRRLRLSLSPPALQDQRADRERLLDGLAAACRRERPGEEPPVRIPPELTAEISARLRAGRWQVEALLDGDLLVGLDPPGGEPPLGFAVDVGTTSIDIGLYDVTSGALLARRLVQNRQSAYGADVITRSQRFREDPAAVRRAVIDSIEAGALELLAGQGIAARRVVRSVLAGNPIMLHILHGFDPLPLTMAPYVPAFASLPARPPADLGFSFQARGRVETLPLISAFVGADTVGMMLALDLEHEAGVSLAADIGTNGEIVLAGRNGLLATSTAAGPAFEGAEISCGLRAGSGAVSAVRLFPDREPELTVAGGGEARGLCGSGLISCTAALLDAGLLDAGGRLLDPAEAAAAGAADYRRRFIRVDGQPAFRLDAPGRPSRLYVTQKDIRQLQLAKAAVRTGIEMLLAETGLRTSDIRRLRLAGNFGSGLSVADAVRVGLIPELPPERVDVTGNAALRGAALVLVSEEYRRRARALPERCGFLELAGRPDFQSRFVAALPFG